MTAHAHADASVAAGLPAVPGEVLVDGPHGRAPVLSMVRISRQGTTVIFGARALQDLVVHHADEVRGLPLAAVLEGGDGGRLWYLAGDPRTRDATLSILRRRGVVMTLLDG